jgi:hypothetical protein
MKAEFGVVVSHGRRRRRERPGARAGRAARYYAHTMQMLSDCGDVCLRVVGGDQW